MSLDSSLNIAFNSLRVTESQLATSSSNVTNASKTGYTTKTYDVGYVTSGDITTPSGGITVGSIDYTLYKSVISDVNESGYYNVISDALDNLSTSMGSTSGDSSLSSALSGLQTALEALELSPDDASQKQNVVTAAEALADNLNDLSDTVQTERLNANMSIDNSVDTINSLLKQLDSLNEQIQNLTNLGQSTANLEDERMVALESLSEQIGVNYFFDSNNNVQVYTTGGTVLLNSTAHELSYTPTSYVTDETVYPGGFDAITVDGKDITDSISGGELAGYIELRDDILVSKQDELDSIASAVSGMVNDALNAGTSYPVPQSVTGDNEFSLSDSLLASGTVRLAVVDSDGTVQGYTDLDLSSFSTVSDFVTAINSIAGVSASLDGDGHLTISSDNSDYGISFNQLDSSVGSDGDSFSSYFGLNNVFSGDSASNIHISDALANDYTLLATGTLSDSSTLAVGDRGISSGDVSVVDDLISALTSTLSFDAAGDMGAQTTTIGNYISSFMSELANDADTALNKADVAQSNYDETKSTMENSTSVNVDEETIKITEYQNQYEAAATIVSTIQSLFSTLLEAVN